MSDTPRSDALIARTDEIARYVEQVHCSPETWNMWRHGTLSQEEADGRYAQVDVSDWEATWGSARGEK